MDSLHEADNEIYRIDTFCNQ